MLATVSRHTPDQPVFYYVMVVWGDKYVDTMLEFTLPCLLAPNNLPALPNLGGSRFLIFTSLLDKGRILASPVFKSLEKIIQIEFIPSPWIEHDISYHLKAARGHKRAAILAAEKGAYCVFLAPDFLLSNGSLSFLVDVARSGKQAVMIPGIRVVTETISQEIRATYSAAADNILNLTSRELVALCLRHVHIEDQRYNWQHPCFSRAPVVCTWNIPGEPGLLVRAFHLHPILVKMNGAESTELLDTNTIDGEFLGFNFPDWDLIHVEPDSDNIVLFSLTDGDDRIQPLELNDPCVEKLWAIAYSVLVNPLHRHYFTKAVKLHPEELNAAWERVERETGLLAYAALSMPNTDEHSIKSYAMRFLPQIDARTIFRELMIRIKRRLINGVNRFIAMLKTKRFKNHDAEVKELRNEIFRLTNLVEDANARLQMATKQLLKLKKDHTPS